MEGDEEVYSASADALIRFATVLVGPGDASDVVSTAIVRCLAAPNWPVVENRRAYLYRAVVNEARRWQASSSRRRRAEALVARRAERLGLTSPSSSDDEGVGGRAAHLDVVAALDQLSVRQRAVIVLTYWEDLRPADVAQRLGVSEGSVRRHLARARRHLKEVVDDAN